MATVSAKIGGVSVVLQYGSLSIDERIEERSTASFVVIDKAGDKSYPRGTPVEIYDGVPALIFSGYIDKPEEEELSPDQGLAHTISCMDQHYLADKRLVVKSYTTQTLKYIVEDIAADYLAAEGVTIGEVQVGPTIGAAIFNHIKASEAFDALKELSGFTWYIDELKKLYFIDRTTNVTWALDGTTNKPLEGSEHLSLGNPLYRNFQYVWGGTDVTSVQVLDFVGDGDTVIFTLGYPLAVKPVVTEDATPMDVGIKGLDTGKDYYWSKGDNTILAEVAPAIGVDVEVTYYGQFPLISASVNSAAITARQAIEGGTGIVEHITREAWHESRESSRESAQAKITQYCQDAEKFTYQTRKSGLAPGQLQDITHSPFGFSAHSMLIESIAVTADVHSIIYDVSCITGPAMGSWAKFFSKLITRQDQSIRIGGELLMHLIVESETLDLAENTDLNSDDFSGGIVNRWLALPPAQSEGCNVEHEVLALSEAPDYWSQAKGQYCWAPYSSGALREGVWDKFSWG